MSVGVDHDTAAVETLRRWWRKMGGQPGAHRLPAADGSRNRLWKWELQKLADGLSVCHFPPGTSKWNKACFVTWRGRPLTSHEVIVNRPYDDQKAV